MKAKILFIPVITTLAAISCQTREKLSDNISGIWTGSPEKIEVPGDYEAQIIKTYTFTQAPDSISETAGEVTVTALLSVSKVAHCGDGIDQPISVNAAATASISGTYDATSYDKMEIKYDQASFKLTVDSAAVNYNYNVLTGEEDPGLTTLRPQLAREIADELAAPVRNSITDLTSVKDMRVKKSVLEAKSGENSITLRRQDL